MVETFKSSWRARVSGWVGGLEEDTGLISLSAARSLAHSLTHSLTSNSLHCEGESNGEVWH